MTAHITSLIIVVALTAGAAGQTATRPQTEARDATPAGDAKRGQDLFTRAGCYQCHGLQAQGGSAGPRLAPKPLAFAAFSRYVRRPTGQMPPFTGKVLSDAQLADVYAFLRGVPEPPPVAAIPLLGQ